MLTVKTSVRPSTIHGNGVFAEERIVAGDTVWQFDPVFDRVISDADVARSPQAFQEFLDLYAYRSVDMDGALILSADNARYLNHSPYPNTRELRFSSLASRTIEVGEEMTCDYGAFCSDPLNFTPNATSIPSTSSDLPHANLYTRIRTSSVGVGVFAIRDIPKGVEPFLGDVGNVMSVPVSLVDALENNEIRKIYRDFCPVLDGAFVAPRDFNRMAIGWYLNHSETPNVEVTPEMHFVAARLIRCGEELTTDYSTYSESAARLTSTWKSIGIV